MVVTELAVMVMRVMFWVVAVIIVKCDDNGVYKLVCCSYDGHNME